MTYFLLIYDKKSFNSADMQQYFFLNPPNLQQFCLHVSFTACPEDFLLSFCRFIFLKPSAAKCWLRSFFSSRGKLRHTHFSTGRMRNWTKFSLILVPKRFTSSQRKPGFPAELRMLQLGRHQHQWDQQLATDGPTQACGQSGTTALMEERTKTASVCDDSKRPLSELTVHECDKYATLSTYGHYFRSLFFKPAIFQPLMALIYQKALLLDAKINALHAVMQSRTRSCRGEQLLVLGVTTFKHFSTKMQKETFEIIRKGSLLLDEIIV